MTALVTPTIVAATEVRAAPVPVQNVREVRTTWTSEFGVQRPHGLTYVPSRRELLVAQDAGNDANVLRLGPDEDPRGTFTLAGANDPDTLAFDVSRNELTTVANGDLLATAGSSITGARPPVARRAIRGLGLADPGGATFDAATGTWYLLDARGRSIIRLQKEGDSFASRSRTPLRGLAGGAVRGIAFNPADGLVYVAVPSARTLFALDASGNVVKKFDLGSLTIGDLRAMTFAPSTDTTDPASVQDLFIADAGTATTFGGVTEVTLAALAAPAAPTQVASLVQVIATSGFNPPSPDPSGVTWMPGPDRLEIVDSEVDEVTGAGYRGANMWQTTRAGAVTDTGTLFPTYSKEPTGAGFDPGSNTLFVSDDSKRRVHVIKAGPDGRYGTGDDAVTFVNALALGSDDTEDPAFNTANGHLYFSDAITAEIYDIDPVNGVFGDGNDTSSHFDVGRFGVTDGEGLAYDAVRNTLLVGDRTSRRIYEITTSGSLVRIIDARVSGLRYLSGLTVAPAIDNPARRDYWIVDRNIDNGASPNENDGRLYEVSAPVGQVDAPPTVSITAPAEGTTVSGANVSVQASVTDDNGVTQVQFFDGTTNLGTDTNGSDGWSVTWNTTGTANGPHTLRATATDTANQTGTDTNSVDVDNNIESPPTVTITSPPEGATVTGPAVSVQADATDNIGVTQVQFFDGLTSLGTDTNGSDGWSVTWNTTTATDGPHTLTATATDTVNQTGSDSNNVAVDNSAPSVSITSPTSGATVSSTTTITADAIDPQGMASVAFVIDGTTTVGTDTNGADGWSVPWSTGGVPNGPHSITARATNAAGLSTTSAEVAVDVSNTGAPVTLNIAIATGNDDIEERASDGRIDRGSTDLDLLLDNTVAQSAAGLRFMGVTIPRNATITNAYVQFRADETWADPTNLTLNGLVFDDAPAFATQAFSLSTKPRTAASAAWAPAPWTERQAGLDQRTANLSAVLQELVNRTGWVPGNALALVITGSGRRVAKAFESGAANAPVLHVEYTG